MPLLRKSWKAIQRVAQEGPLSVAAEVRERMSEAYHEKRLGVHTATKRYLEDLGIHSPQSVHYYPSDYRTIYKTFRHLSIRPAEDVFLDFGSGMGRAALVAATYPFRRVIGVELSEELHAIAVKNASLARPRLKCTDVVLERCDATTFQVPDDVTTVFFYNPFRGEMLAQVFANLNESLRRSPRRMSIAFKNTTEFDKLDCSSWLRKTVEFRACDAPHKVAIFETCLKSR